MLTLYFRGEPALFTLHFRGGGELRFDGELGLLVTLFLRAGGGLVSESEESDEEHLSSREHSEGNSSEELSSESEEEYPSSR